MKTGMQATLRSFLASEHQLRIMRELSKMLSKMEDEDARQIYRRALELVMNEVREKPLLDARLSPPKEILSDPQKKRVWNEVADLLADIVASRDDILLWSLCDKAISRTRSKLLGQYFTPSHVASFALGGLQGPPDSILDPMLGHGVFLKCALDRYPSCRLHGVEVDALPLMAARMLLGESATIEHADVFEWATKKVDLNPADCFSAVVGNPAYVNYQNLDQLTRIAEETKHNTMPYRNFLIRTLRYVAGRKNLGPDVSSLFSHWSGYSDLSVYALVLSWLLTEKRGQIAFVMSSHWMERDYGSRLRDFLSSRGTVRAIVTHRNGEWFPGAQIPASVIVYSKGKVAPRQESLGIPFVEIHAPRLTDLAGYLDSEVGGDFWTWIDGITSPCRLESLDVSFRKWRFSSDNMLFGMSAASFQDLQIPGEIKGTVLRRLQDVGWSVHQGLRTGCNELFYVRELDGRKHLWSVRYTKEGKKTDTVVSIPDELLMPVIQRIPPDSPLRIGIEQADVRLISLSGAVTEADRKSLTVYPKDWLESWRVKDMKTIPPSLSQAVENWSTMLYEGKGRGPRPVVSLSAIKTNVYRPTTKSGGRIPPPARFWYQIPITRRHFGTIVVPRVSYGPTRAYLNKDPGSVIIDANFLTFVPENGSLPAERLWVWLNSNSFRLLCELNGSPLGGGALKLEATLLARLPVLDKVMSLGQRELASLVDLLDRKVLSNAELIEIGKEIDKVMLGHAPSIRLAESINRHVSRRSRHSKREE